MAQETKEWVKASYRSKKYKTGSVHVSVSSDALRYAGVKSGVDLKVRVYPLNNGNILLRFREVK